MLELLVGDIRLLNSMIGANGPRLVLASNSPRRRRLLALGGWEFTIKTVAIDETPLPGEPPDAFVMRLAINKAQAVLPSVPPGSIIIAADTTVADRLLNNTSDEPHLEILGKPANGEEARSMLQRLRGHSHKVYTAIAVLDAADDKLITDMCITEVLMRSYSEAEIDAYVASGDPLDKAGAYAIQHPSFQPVESLRWCYGNVVGLPLCLLSRALERIGIPARSEISRAYLDQKDGHDQKDGPYQKDGPCLIDGPLLTEVDQA